MLDELRSFGITNPWAMLQSVRNFALTVWDPTRSDIRQGVNALVYGALRNPRPQRIRQLRTGGIDDSKMIKAGAARRWR